ncbi:MAG: ferritin-like domain-containing protein [Myxococcaceae bacterium]
MHKTSAQWWAAVKVDAVAFEGWLLDQYRGEVTAAGRIEALRDAFAAPGSKAARVLTVIAGQEREHAEWVAGLLRTRGVTPKVEDVPARYWDAVLGQVRDLETGAAVGAHAEEMRLERIVAIASDPGAPADVRAVFARILPQERFHARAFRALASAAALEATAGAHHLGRELLGLT